MKIRLAKKSDIPALSRLIRSIISATPYYTPEAKAEEKRKHNAAALKECLRYKNYYVCLIAEDGKREIAGFAIGRNESGVFWADWIGVPKTHRRKGVAEVLMKSWEKELQKKGVHKIWCDTRTNNKESIALLKKLKYKKLGTFKNGWYKQDFFLWEKSL